MQWQTGQASRIQKQKWLLACKEVCAAAAFCCCCCCHWFHKSDFVPSFRAVVYHMLDFSKSEHLVLADFFGGMLAVYTVVQALYSALALLVFDVGTKWVLVGRRQPGNYSWDASKYCCRWVVAKSALSMRCVSAS